jgi:HSP20 family protein
MVLIKSNPDSILNERFFPQRFHNMFNSLLDDSKLSIDNMSFMPASDIIETKDAYEIKISLPGIKKEDVKISVEGNLLNIEGERKAEFKEENDKFVKREFSYGKFSRSFNIGKSDASRIDAEMKDGVLHILLPKAQESKLNQITIK